MKFKIQASSKIWVQRALIFLMQIIYYPLVARENEKIQGGIKISLVLKLCSNWSQKSNNNPILKISQNFKQ